MTEGSEDSCSRKSAASALLCDWGKSLDSSPIFSSTEGKNFRELGVAEFKIIRKGLLLTLKAAYDVISSVWLIKNSLIRSHSVLPQTGRVVWRDVASISHYEQQDQQSLTLHLLSDSPAEEKGSVEHCILPRPRLPYSCTQGCRTCLREAFVLFSSRGTTAQKNCQLCKTMILAE